MAERRRTKAEDGTRPASGDTPNSAAFNEGAATLLDRKPPTDTQTGTPGAPDKMYLLGLRDELQTLFQEQDDQIDALRKNREMVNVTVLPDELRFVAVDVRDPTIAEENQRVSATLSLNMPTLQVTPARKGDKAEENSTLREHWTEQVLLEAGKRADDAASWFEGVVDGAVADGGGWCKLLFTRDTWSARYNLQAPDYTDLGKLPEYLEKVEEAKKGAGVPFALVHVDARSVYPVWGADGGLHEILEVTERPFLSTLRRYGLGLSKKGEIVPGQVGVPLNEVQGRGLPSTVQFLERWDREYVTYLVCDLKGGKRGAQVVKQFAHGYGRVPYFHAFGFMMNHWRGRKVGWGVGQAKRWLVEYRSFLLTVHAQMAARDLMPPMEDQVELQAQPLMGKNGEPPKAERYELGKIYPGTPGHKRVPFQFQGNLEALNQQIALVSDMIDKLNTPRVQSEIGGGLEGAGFAINQIMAAAAVMQGPIRRHLEQMLAEITRFLWHLVRTQVKETVWVQRGEGEQSGWLGAGPDDLTEGVGIKWELDPEQATAKLIEERYWAERVKNGSASIKQMTEALGDNYDEVRFERKLEELRQAPWYQDWYAQRVLEEVQRGDLLRKAAEQVAMTGQMPGAPGIGGVPSPMGGAPGSAPDMGQLAMSPNGAMGALPSGPGPSNGSVPGTAAGLVVPERSAMPMPVAV